MKEPKQDLHSGYENLCKAAVNKSCWGVLHPDFFYLRCLSQSKDCYHLVAGKPVSREVAEDPQTEIEIKVFKNRGKDRRLWRMSSI